MKTFASILLTSLFILLLSTVSIKASESTDNIYFSADSGNAVLGQLVNVSLMVKNDTTELKNYEISIDGNNVIFDDVFYGTTDINNLENIVKTDKMSDIDHDNYVDIRLRFLAVTTGKSYITVKYGNYSTTYCITVKKNTTSSNLIQMVYSLNNNGLKNVSSKTLKKMAKYGIKNTIDTENIIIYRYNGATNKGLPTGDANYFEYYDGNPEYMYLTNFVNGYFNNDLIECDLNNSTRTVVATYNAI